MPAPGAFEDENLPIHRREEGTGDPEEEATDEETGDDDEEAAPADMLDESNPFFIPKKVKAEEVKKDAYKDTSDAANDILRKMLERRASRFPALDLPTRTPREPVISGRPIDRATVLRGLTAASPSTIPRPSPASRLRDRRLQASVVGQAVLIDRLIVALLAGGHVLIEGVPGLAKTRAVRALAGALDLPYRRIQFTPDLLPADLTGTQIYHPATGEFDARPGPIVTSVLLADEVNRAPAKVQSALLEAMQEGQVTIGDRTIVPPDPFWVLATQNPVEHEGTYPLPEAQLDRFLLKLTDGYPAREAELAMIDLPNTAERDVGPADPPILGPADVRSLAAARRRWSAWHPRSRSISWT